MLTLKLDAKSLLAIVTALLAAGIWLGVLQNRVTQLERHQKFDHGTYTIPGGE
jgi:Mg2+/citrate symporter